MDEQKIEEDILKMQQLANKEIGYDGEGSSTYNVHIETVHELIEDAYLKGYSSAISQLEEE
jgi:hypothetical protein